MIKVPNECLICGKPTYGHLSKLCNSCREKLISKEVINKEKKLWK